jgi:hypothetical protein
MSDGPSIQNHRITKADFRPCSTCMSHSQALLCFYTQRLVSNQPERTFARLRYFLGGDRPSQTTRQTVSSSRFHGKELEFKFKQGGISTMTPRFLAEPLQSLPPILHSLNLNSLSSYSKGAQGLSVFLRVYGICTANSISLSYLSRQCGNRYSIRAGRNLPDKEFRYLRTVIVTAAVYWGFSSELQDYSLTPLFNLPAPGRSQALYIDLIVFAEPCVFVKQSPPPSFCDL